MGNIFKVVPTPPYRMHNIKKAQEENLFLFDSRYFLKNGNFAFVYGVANRAIALPFDARIMNDFNGKTCKKRISYCYDMYGRVSNYILPNQVCVLCIENLDDVAFTYGFTAFDSKECI